MRKGAPFTDYVMKTLGVNTLLVKDDVGKQGAQLRMGGFFCIAAWLSRQEKIEHNF
jgi:hypothetical protein